MIENPYLFTITLIYWEDKIDLPLNLNHKIIMIIRF